jgi:hypothetical protein
VENFLAVLWKTLWKTLQVFSNKDLKFKAIVSKVFDGCVKLKKMV